MSTHHDLTDRRPVTNEMQTAVDADGDTLPTHISLRGASGKNADDSEAVTNREAPSNSTPGLAAALARAQGTIRPAARCATNPHYDSRYADLASVWEACRRPLTENGLSVVQMPDYDPATGCVSVTTSLLHESGESITSTLRAPVAKTDPQGVGSAITYLRRYSLAAFVGVAPEDDDGEAAIQAPETEAPTGDSTVLANQSGIAQWPFGDRKGEPIRDFTVEELKAGREWCLKKNKRKFAALIQQIDQELDARDLEMV